MEIAGKTTIAKNDVFKQLLPGEKWNNHLKNILINKQRTSNFPPDSLEPGILDYPTTENELNKASYIIRPGKASGYDSVSNEMILGLMEVNPGLVIKLFNCILSENYKIYQWSVSLITPIFKKRV